MSYLTYLASEYPIPESRYLWPLYQGASDIYTEKPWIAEVMPELEDWEGFVGFLKSLPGEMEIWRIWQGIEYRPVIRSTQIPVSEVQAHDLLALTEKDVFHATTTQYEIPVQYRIVLVPSE